MALLTSRWTQLRNHPIQASYWTSPHRFNVVSAGRRSGKTELAKRKLVKSAIRGTAFDGARFFAGAPIREQAKRIYWQDLKALTPPAALARAPYESDLIIPYVNGSEIHVVGMDKPERVEGSPWDGGVLDEYGNMKEDVWDAHVRPAFADRNGWCDFIGVPEGRNHYYKLDLSARSDMAAFGAASEWGSFTWKSADILSEKEISEARRKLPFKLFQQEYEGSFVDLSGFQLFDREKFLVDGKPIPWPSRCEYVFATVDTAVKAGRQHDGTAVSYWARSKYFGHPLVLLDWDIVQIDGDLLDVWLRGVFDNLEHMARECGARLGSAGAFIEDKQTGSILIQQALRKGWPAQAINADLTSMGKDGRALSVATYGYQGLVKMSQRAYEKTVVFKDRSENHWDSQVFGFKVGAGDGGEDDLLDTASYGMAIALGDEHGH